MSGRITILFDMINFEYHVPGREEGSTWHADTKMDAIVAARAIYGQDVQIEFRRVPDRHVYGAVRP